MQLPVLAHHRQPDRLRTTQGSHSYTMGKGKVTLFHDWVRKNISREATRLKKPVAETPESSDLFLAAGRDEVDVSGLVRQREGHH